MTFPKHISPRQGAPAATAPYNFVPLPQAVLPAAKCVAGEPWRGHDRYDPSRLSGWIELTITTETPLFIRGAQKPDSSGGWEAGRDARLRPEPAMTTDGHLVIPGSSLRGMLRTLVEILAFAKVQPVANTRPFFRDFSGKNNRLHNAYANRIKPAGQLPQAGFLHHTKDGWAIQPTTVWRVPHDVLPGSFEYGAPPRYTPQWGFQHRPCQARHNGAGEVVALRFDLAAQQHADGDEWQLGTLVLTGAAPQRRDDHGQLVGREKADFFFLPPAEGVVARTVTDAQMERFHDSDQVSDWQQRAFPVDQPHGLSPQSRRRAKGHTRSSEPVFFVPDSEHGVRFFGRARHFRMPYDLALSELVPAAVGESLPGLDLAEAMFGRVGRSAADQLSVRGRVRVEDAVASAGEAALLQEIVPKPLLSPKPTTFAHYLTQDGTRSAAERTTYLHGDTTAVRGHKLYWHRWPTTGDLPEGLALVTEVDTPSWAKGPKRERFAADPQAEWRTAVRSGHDELHTLIRPVRPGIPFRGSLRFDNLTHVELGALLVAIRLPDGCRHKLGMGKPLGMGSVRLEAVTHVVDRLTRYSSWRATGELSAPEVEAVERCCRDQFLAVVLQHARRTGEPMATDPRDLGDVKRLEALFLLLRWEQRPSPDRTEQLLLKVFQERRVLPGPHRVCELPEPEWPGPAPTAADVERLPSNNEAEPEDRGRTDEVGGQQNSGPREISEAQRRALTERFNRRV